LPRRGLGLAHRGRRREDGEHGLRLQEDRLIELLRHADQTDRFLNGGLGQTSFAVAFDGKGNGYVSNQDSNVVAWFQVDLVKPEATANSVAKYLRDLKLSGTFLDATFVASAVSDLPAVAGSPPAVKASDGGLGTILGPDTTKATAGAGHTTVKYKVQNSVRDVAIVDGLLLVVDEPGGVVRTYDAAKGTYLGASSVADAPGAVLASPTHLLVTADAVYVSFANQIYTAPLSTGGSPTLTFSPLFHADKGSLSGMAVDGGGNIDLANRTEMSITSDPTGFGDPRWSIDVKDQPEFLLYVESQAS
jgi:hypothetical protein